MLKRTLTTADIKMIDMYSARKIMTKGTDLNSVLNPLTSSDSPSEKSNGDRFVSAKEDTSRSTIALNKKTPSTDILGHISLK